MSAPTRDAFRRLTPALAASTAAHVALLLGLLAVVHTMPATLRNAAPTLSVVLARAQPSEPAPVEVPAAPPTIANTPRAPTPAVVVPPVAVPLTPPVPAAIPAANDSMSPATTGGAAQARVEFGTATTLARLGEAFRTRSLLEFPPEIDTPVDVVGNIDVQYPAAALEERREATVIAWVVVEASGQVEEIAIIEGDPEFGEPVQDALLKARFLPASNRGQPIRYHKMLEFRFRLDNAAPGASALPQ